MKRIILILFTVIVFIALNAIIIQKETVLKNGKTVLLQLAPVDPRSLIQGDYMILAYRIAPEAEESAFKDHSSEGKLVIKLDKNNVGHFVRIYKNETLREDEWLLHFRKRGRLRIGAESFFFQEGHASYYSNARYGELKAAQDGKCVLVGLRDDRFRKLKPH